MATPPRARPRRAGRTSSTSSTARTSPGTSRRSIRPSARCWCATIPKATRLEPEAGGTPAASCPTTCTTGAAAGSCSSCWSRRRRRSWSALRGDKKVYDLEMRPQLMVQAIHELQDARHRGRTSGRSRASIGARIARRIVTVARRGGRDKVGCIVLGRGEDDKKVREWLTTAARVPGFIGFAVGRTTFWEPLVDWRAKRRRARPPWPRSPDATASSWTSSRTLARHSRLVSGSIRLVEALAASGAGVACDRGSDL